MFKREIKPLSEGMAASIAKSINKLLHVDEAVNRLADRSEGDVKSQDISSAEAVKSDGSAKKAPARKGDQAQADSMEKVKEETKLDTVNPGALKKKFSDRKDKDIDNDGDTDSSDEYLHSRRKAIAKAMASEAKQLSGKDMKDAFASDQSKAQPKGKVSLAKAPWDMKKEEAQLDEVSIDKLTKYRAANEKDRERLSKEIGFIKGEPTETQKKLIAKLQSRNTADMLAFKKDAPYLFKSMGKKAAKVDASDAYDNPRIDKSYLKYKDQKESLEVELDEISQDMKARYAKKATTSLKRATTTHNNANQRAADASARIQKAYDRNRSAEQAYKDQDRAATQAANQKKVMAKRTDGLKRANEEAELDEKLGANVVRGDNYIGVPDRVQAQARLAAKKMNAKTAEDATKAMDKALSDLGWEMTISGKYVKEEEELDEISKKKLADYLDKSHVAFKKTQASGSPMTDKQKRRYSTGSEAGDNAYNKQSGRARVNATEGVELDEISKKKVGEYSDKARDEFRKQQASGSPMTDKQKRRYSTGSDAGENAYAKVTGRARVNATEETELDEMKQPFIVIDTADGNKVVAMASDEIGAKRSINSAERPPMNMKDKSTLKIVMSRKKQFIGRPLMEAKETYTISHKTFSSAVQHALAQAEKRGYTVDEDDWDRKVAMGPRKPGTGKTNSYEIALMKDGKETKRKLQMQVYYDQGRYELNMYIS